MRTEGNPKTGFTLLEVLVAVVFMTVGLLATGRAISMNIRVQRHSQNLLTATTLAQDMLAEEEVALHKSLGTTAGGFGEEFSGYQWTKHVQESTSPDMLSVSLTVQWEEGQRIEALNFATLVPRRQIAKGVH